MAAVTASKTKVYSLQRCPPVNIMECKIGYNPDRLSQLPNDILVKLVSQLPVKDAVATSILSSRWRYIWTWTTNLDFDGDLIHDRRQQRYYRNDFIKWVNSVIDKHNPETQLERFRVCFDLSGGKTSYIINKWIEYAMKKRVQILELMFFESGGARGCSTTYVFSSNEFKSLKVLSLICVHVSQEVLESLLSNCPLERLEVAYSLTLINLRVKGSPSLALKHLKLGRCTNVKSIEICNAINLVSFYYSCFDPPSRLVLRNVPKLVDIDIHWFEVFYIRHALAAISCCVSQLQILHLHHLTPYNEEEDDVSYPILTNLKELKLSLNASDSLMFHYIVPLMEKAPNLQRLVVKLRHFGVSMNKKPCTFWKPAKRPYHCLKEVEVTGYLGPPNDELILYFIESAVSLEKIIVNPCESEAWPRRRYKTDSSTIKLEEEGRDHALRYIKEKIPKTIEFVCL